jgi:Ca2+-transporting ATPase
VKRDTADYDIATAISEKRKKEKRKKGPEPQKHVEVEPDADPTPFRFRANDLAMMLDPKRLDTLEDIGGIDGLLDGLGTTIDMGLGDARSTTGLSGRGDGRPGAGVGVSHQHDPERGEETVPAITLTDPEDVGTNWNSTAAFAASLEVRRRTYGQNVLPPRTTKSLLSLIYIGLKDKVLVCHVFPHFSEQKYKYLVQVLLSIAAVVSLALGLFQDFGSSRSEGEAPVDWVEGVAIMVAILITVSAPS